MKRDCGKGELVPAYWRVLYCASESDKEGKHDKLTKDEALKIFDDLCKILKDNKFADVRLYVCDKQGYANCVRSWSQLNGLTTDRLNEI